MYPNNDLTVLLIIKDRVNFTLRWMSFADRISFPFKVIIADGGKDPRVSTELTKPANFPNVNYEYIQYPYDETYAEYYKKVADVLGRVRTQFCVMADDDNFYSIYGLKSAVEFLKTHPDYSACQGYTIGFRLDPSSSFYYGKNVSFSSPLQPHYSLDNNTGAERLSVVTANNFTIVYAVEHTQKMKRILDETVKINFHDLYMSEAFFNFMTVSHGKVRQEQCPYLYRQFNTYNSCNDQLSIIADNFDRMLWDTFSGEFANFVTSVAVTISNKDGCSMEDAVSIVKRAFRNYTAPTIIDCLDQTRAKESISMLVRRRIIQNKNNIGVNLIYRIYRSIKDMSIRMPVQDKLVLSREKTLLSKYLTSVPMSGQD